MHRSCILLKQMPKIFASSKAIYRSLPRGQSWSLICPHSYQNHYSGMAALGIRSYSAKARRTGRMGKGEQATRRTETGGGMPEAYPQITLEILEGIASAPGFSMCTRDDPSRLGLVEARLWELFLYMFQPHEPNQEKVEQFGNSLLFSAVGPGTEIQRARDAIALIVYAIIDCLVAIHKDSKLRKHTRIFDAVDDLSALVEEHIDKDGKVENWLEFWGIAQLQLLGLHAELAKADFERPWSDEAQKRGGKKNVRAEPKSPLEDLESRAAAPWLKRFPEHHGDRLELAGSQLLALFMYLAYVEATSTMNHVIAFMVALAKLPLDPEIVRARKAIAIITRGVVDCLSTIPMDSKVRAKYSAVFDVLDPILALRDKHLTDERGRVKNWPEFWSEGQRSFLLLGKNLEKAGFPWYEIRKRKFGF